MQEEITRLVQGLDDSALRFIEACVRHERETRNAPQVPPPSTPHPGGQFTVPENVRHLTSEQLDAVSKAFLDWYKASVSTTQGRSRGRLWLVFLLIRYGALRLGEVLSIDDRTDLDFARSVVSVRGQNFRELQFPEAIMTEIRQVLESPLMFACAAKCCTSIKAMCAASSMSGRKTSICRKSSSAPGSSGIRGA